MLGETPDAQNGNTENNEEKKEQTPKETTEKRHNYLDDLLNMDFSPITNNNTTTPGLGTNIIDPNVNQSQQNQQLDFLGSMTQPLGGVQLPYNQANLIYPQGLIQPNFGQTMPFNFPSGYNTLRQQHPVNQPINNANGIHESLSPISASKVQEQTTDQPQVM